MYIVIRGISAQYKQYADTYYKQYAYNLCKQYGCLYIKYTICLLVHKVNNMLAYTPCQQYVYT